MSRNTHFLNRGVFLLLLGVASGELTSQNAPSRALGVDAYKEGQGSEDPVPKTRDGSDQPTATAADRTYLMLDPAELRIPLP